MNLQRNSLHAQLFLSACCISIVLMSAIAVVWYSNASLKRAEAEKQRLTDAMMNFKDLRYHVVQIQQFLTDASAVGEDDYQEAQEERKAAHESLKRLSGLAPEMKEGVAAADKAVDTLYDTGTRMADAYIKEGREAGNAIMKDEANGFDARSAELAGRLDGFAKELAAKSARASVRQQETMQRMFLASAGLGMVAIVLIMFSGRLLYTRLLRVLGAEPAFVAGVAREVAGGNLSLDLAETTGTKESLLGNLRHMADELSLHMREINQASKQIAQSAYQITDISENIAQCSREEQSHTGEVTQATEVLRAASESVVQHSQEVLHTAQVTRDSAQKGLLAVKENMEEMEKAVSAAQRAEEQMMGLNEANERIQEITTTIAGITDQTNLLALNAAIEAARAGEHGRGFAVVADEVRKLAGSASHANSEISQIIGELSRQLTESMTALRGITECTRAGMTKADSTSAVIREIAANVDRSAAASEEISALSADQMNRLSELVTRLEGLFTGIAQSGNKIGITRGISQDLYHVTERLTELLGQFRFERTVQVEKVENENRRHPRAAKNLLVRVELSGREEEGLTADLSLGGMRLRLQRDIGVATGELVSLKLQLPCEDLAEYRSREPLRVSGRVKWQNRESADWVYGIEFEGVGLKETMELKRCFDYFDQAATFPESVAA